MGFVEDLLAETQVSKGGRREWVARPYQDFDERRGDGAGIG